VGNIVPTNPLTGFPLLPSSYTAAQSLAATLETRQGDNELLVLGLVAVPAGDANADRAALAGYVTTENMPRRY